MATANPPLPAPRGEPARSVRYTPAKGYEWELKYRQKGNTLFPGVIGALGDFWVGRYYVGVGGLIGVPFIITGSLLWFWGLVHDGHGFFAGRVMPPPASLGLGISRDWWNGGIWQAIVLCATISFWTWALREAEIARKLNMGYHVPIVFSTVVIAWTTIQLFRPILLGSWSQGFQLGFTAHLDWVSNVGYSYQNFYYNPLHMLGIAILFGSTMFLAMHGATILSGVYRSKQDGALDVQTSDVDVENRYWLDLLGYSVGEAGIHRLGFVFAIGCMLISSLCILLSGTVVKDWVSWWDWWDRIWKGLGG